MSRDAGNDMTKQQEIRFPTPEEFNPDQFVNQIQSHYRLLEQPVYQVKRIYLDSFDWRMYSGGVALWTEQIDEASSICQNGIPNAPGSISFSMSGSLPRSPEDIPPGRIRDIASKILGVRVFLPQVEVKSKVRCIRMLDTAEKTVLRIMIETNSSRAHGKGKYVACGDCIRLLPVRGYQQPLSTISELITSSFGVSAAKQSLLDDALKSIGMRAGNYSTKLCFSFDPNMRADLAAKQIHLFLLDIIEANVPGVKANLDSEFLHDLRVAVRRTRSALTQIKGVFNDADTDKFKQRMAWVGEITGPTRDMDVFLLGFENYLECIPERFRQNLAPLHLFLEKHQQIEHQIMVKKLNSPHFRRLLKEWRIFLEMPVEDDPEAPKAASPVQYLANKRIYKMYKLVVKLSMAITEESPAVDFHSLRKECKKLRYLMEFFHGLYPKKKISRLIKSVKKLLDNLGDIQDFEVQAEKLTEYARQMVKEGKVPHATLLAIGMLVDGLLRRQQQARVEFEDCFASFSTPDNQRMFRSLFADTIEKDKA